MLKKIALLSTLAMCMGSTYAYQAEVGAEFSYYDAEYVDMTYARAYALDGKFYLQAVEEKDSPLNEAAFLNRASNITGKIVYLEAPNLRTNQYNVGIEYFIPNSNFYLNTQFEYYKEDDDLWDVESSEKVYTAEIGYLPTDGLLVAAGFTSTHGDFVEDHAATLRTKYIMPIANMDLNLEANAKFGEEDIYYGLATDLYLNKTFSVGVAYQNSNSTLNDDQQLKLNVKKFFSPNISLELKADFYEYYERYGARLGYRF
ncbi:putative porin [Acinetobacter shaoyimingii]|uniref:Putative porin n=1 Tax=Acinetobacter shaoyimingii TaxID=2715164 RepID=A0A6G8RRS0_9GAMM|nr:putative porin [Acinetobacter shaoyimingii]QIO04632.1 putative porin [Acinetobacter shaoyimingii]